MPRLPFRRDSRLIDSALSTVQAATHPLTTISPRSNGLQPQALTDEAVAQVTPKLGQAEARLLSIYRLISQGQHREALGKADELVRDYPNFHLAHLVHGDLLSLQVRPVRQLGDVPDTKATAAAQQLAILREESRRRMLALTERPPEGAVPSQFIALASQSRHAIAVDASKSRLYLFENQTPAASGSRLAPAPKLKLLGDFYISVGLLGTEKAGRRRQAHAAGRLLHHQQPQPVDSLPDLYGVGALPINYPNPLDVQRGKTGSGIWLHGTPRGTVRARSASVRRLRCAVQPRSGKACSATVQIRTTPVVIAPQLQWVQPERTRCRPPAQFEASLDRLAQRQGPGTDLQQLKGFYCQSASRTRASTPGPMAWSRGSKARCAPPTHIQRTWRSRTCRMLHWRDTQDTMVVTFGEVAHGPDPRRHASRQYWARERDQWKIFFEGTP